MKEIFLSKISENGNQELVVEGDQHTIWAYLLKENDGKMNLEFDGFICSRGTIVESSSEIKKFIEDGLAPPLMSAFVNEYSIQKNVSEEKISIEWDGGIVTVKLEEVVYLRMDTQSRASYSKAISKKGPYGNPM